MSDVEWWRSIFQQDPNSGIGYAPNVSYRPDGRPHHGDSQDQTFCILKHEEPDGPEIRLFGLFNGFNDGRDAANFAAGRMVSELLLAEKQPIVKDMTAEEVTALLRHAFTNVEAAYSAEVLSEPLARRYVEIMNKQNGRFNEEQLHRLDSIIAGGTTAMVALLIDDRLYVANCGNSRAVLVHEVDEDFELFQLSTTHDNSTPEEQKRISALGVFPSEVAAPTRCIGDYFRKGGYKESNSLRAASSDPVISLPSIAMPVMVDDSFRFLLLASSGVIQTLVEVGYDKEAANEQLVIHAAQELHRSHSQSLMAAAQAVLDSISRQHQDHFQRGALPVGCRKREDMTLVLVHFSQPISLDTQIPLSRLTLDDDGEDVAAETLPLDENGCIAPYVDFANFYTHPDKDKIVQEIDRISNSYRTESIEEEEEEEENVHTTL